MQDKFIVPMAAMLAGVVVWVAFVILWAVLRRKAWWSRRVEVGASLGVGGLVVFSAFSWIQLGGPAVGQVVRLVVLAVMAAFTYWKIGTAAAAVLSVAAGIVGVLAVIAFL